MKVAILGTKCPSPYGRWVAYNLAQNVVEKGGTVISTVGDGIDSTALNGAMSIDMDKAIGYSIAYEGVIYPKLTRALQEILDKKGQLNHTPTEYHTPGERIKYVYERIADECDVMIIVEGHEKSSKEMAANLAVKLDKALYAVPGNINQPCSVLPNKLLAEGAMTITSVIDLDFMKED